MMAIARLGCYFIFWLRVLRAKNESVRRIFRFGASRRKRQISRNKSLTRLGDPCMMICLESVVMIFCIPTSALFFVTHQGLFFKTHTLRPKGLQPSGFLELNGRRLSMRGPYQMKRGFTLHRPRWQEH